MLLSKLFSMCLTEDYDEIGECTNFAVRHDDTTLYILFQASNGNCDWQRNLDFHAQRQTSSSRPALHVHRGFLRAWEEVRSTLLKEIISHDGEKIVIAGYSHGAALALLCYEYAVTIRRDIRENITGYGFGSPRVYRNIGRIRASDIWKNFTVIRNIDDIVTHLPPAIFGYSHVGRMLKIGKKGKYSKIDAHRPESIMAELLLYESDAMATHVD